MKAYFENRAEPLMANTSPGFRFPPHLHSQLELLYVQNGEMTVTVREQTGTLPAGGLVVVFPNQIHSYLDFSCGGVITTIVADLAYTGGYLDTLMQFHPVCPFLMPEQLHPNVSYAIGEMVRENASCGAGSKVYGPMLQLILARIMPLLELRQNHSKDHQELTWQIVNYVNEHYREKLTLDMLARGIGLSRYRLSHVFSEKIGQSFSSYVSSIRLAYARTLLTETDMPVTVIAEEAGFESQRTFFRTFREQYGMSPQQYRRQNQNILL